MLDEGERQERKEEEDEEEHGLDDEPDPLGRAAQAVVVQDALVLRGTEAVQMKLQAVG